MSDINLSQILIYIYQHIDYNCTILISAKLQAGENIDEKYYPFVPKPSCIAKISNTCI